MTYQDFLNTKVELAKDTGIDVPVSELNPALMPHQKDAVHWALKGGRRALFESFGLGKTVQELEFCYQAIKHEGGNALIVLPLGVKGEFARDAVQLLHYPEPAYIRHMEEAAGDGNIYLTNYERVRDGDIDPKGFTAASLDEASVLRSFGSKTYQTFLDKFKGVPYKLVATATPSPNRYKELVHYAAYLEIMDSGQALTRFFQRDSTKANNLTLYPAQEDEFWMWLSSWGLFVTKPSDVNPAYSDAGYNLLELQVNWREQGISYGNTEDRDGQLCLWNDAAQSLSAEAKVKHDSVDARIKAALECVEQALREEVEQTPGKLPQCVVWVDLNYEQEAVERELKKRGITYSSLYGSQTLEEREDLMMKWRAGETQIFLTKPQMYGQGVNLQQCAHMVFVGIDYEFEKFIQAIHREHRFGQEHKVTVDIIYMENEQTIKRVLLEKWQNHDRMVAKMIDIIKTYGLPDSNKAERLQRKMGVKEVEVEGRHYKLVNDDCVHYTKQMADNSVDLIHTSIPFGNHYEYSSNYADFGHNENDDRFFDQMDYLTPELLRVLKPGRVAAIHVKDRVQFGNVTGDGMPTIEPFHCDCVAHYKKHGFAYFGMITVVTDVVRENNQTYRLGWTEQCKDGTKMGVGCPEYILLFRKLPTDRTRAYADTPVEKSKEEYTRAQWQIDAHAYWRSSGDRPVTKEEVLNAPVSNLQKIYRQYSREHVYSYEEHVKLAKALDADGHLPATFMVVAPGSWTGEVWDDINRMKTLNTSQSRRKQQMHVCPLQIDIVERIINRYSNKGDIVFDPFAGLGTVPMQAVKMGRYGIGTELSADYFRDALGYLEAADNEVDAPTLFDFIGIREGDTVDPRKEELKAAYNRGVAVGIEKARENDAKAGKAEMEHPENDGRQQDPKVVRVDPDRPLTISAEGQDVAGKAV